MPDQTLKIRRNIFFPRAQWRALRTRADEMGLKPNALVNVAVATYLGTSSKYVPLPSLAEKSKPYVPPDYRPSQDEDSKLPDLAVPWAIVEKVGNWLDVNPKFQTVGDIKKRFPQIQRVEAMVALDAYVTEFYADQLDEIEKRKKGKM